MNNENFCFWMQGYCEIDGIQPADYQWKLIVEHLTLAQECDRSGYYHFDHFVDTLQGFLDINGTDVTNHQWAMITTTLQNCFNKVTSNVEDLAKGKPSLCPDDITEILDDVIKKRQKPSPELIPPYLPPHHPLKGPRPGEIICGGKAFCSCEGQSTNPSDFQASLEQAYDSQNAEASLIDR